MTTGEGIFWGLMFVGCVILYSVTKDRWKWRKIIKWGAVVLAIPIAGTAAWLGAVDYLDSRAHYQTEFWDLKAGISKDELVFKKGKPDYEKDGFWVYGKDTEKLLYLVQIKNEKVRSVTAFGREGVYSNLPNIQGISNYSSQASIAEKFGAPDAVSYSKDKTQRLLSYLKYGLSFELEKDSVIGLGIIDPAAGPLIFNDM